MKCDYFEKQCDCEHTIEVELSSKVEFVKINCKICGGVYLFKIDQYFLHERLGKGASGEVYFATNKNKQQVAIKMLIQPDQSNLDHFIRECMVQKELKHKNIIQLLDQGNWGDNYYIVMEYFPGQNLADIIKKRKYLSEREAVKIVLSVLNGLLYAKQSNIVHRDIKPENIYITDSGQVKILDMGLAKIMGETYGLTATNVIKGSPCFMSPEQLDETKSVDTRTDIYALGATFYNTLCGVTPFREHKNILALAAAKKKNAYRPLLEIKADISPELARIVEKSMADIENRYQDGESMMHDLYSFYQAM